MLGLASALVMACVNVTQPAIADPNHVSITDLKVGLVCGSPESRRICFQTDDIQVTGEGRCVFNHQPTACTWYGESFDYELPEDQVELNCNWSSNIASNVGTPTGLDKPAAKEGTYKLVLKGRSGHFFQPQFTGFVEGDPTETEEMRQSCQYNGASVFDVVFRLHFPEPDPGKPHFCPGSQEANSGVEGISTVGFLITKEGTVADPRLVATSGDAKLDAAALRCVRTWRYRPALQYGTPVEAHWTVDIAWNSTRPPELSRRLAECARSLRVKYTDPAAVDGTTEFAIVYDGPKVKKVMVTRPSGNGSLDEAAASCVSQPNEEFRETVVINSHLQMIQTTTFSGRIVWRETASP